MRQIQKEVVQALEAPEPSKVKLLVSDVPSAYVGHAFFYYQNLNSKTLPIAFDEPETYATKEAYQKWVVSQVKTPGWNLIKYKLQRYLVIAKEWDLTIVWSPALPEHVGEVVVAYLNWVIDNKRSFWECPK